MKSRIVYLFFSLFGIALLNLGNAGGAGAVQNRDRTDSPLASGFCGNVGCHSAGNFDPEIAVELLDGEEVVTTYEPGKTYTYRITIAATNAASRFGFQTVALGTENVNAGSFGSAPTNTRLTEVDNRTYFEQGTRLESNTTEIEWTAPAIGTGAVRFYASGIAANGNGSSSGDGADALDEPLTIEEGTATSVRTLTTISAMQLFPNPVDDQLNITLFSKANDQFELSIFNSIGQQQLRRAVRLDIGENQIDLPVANLTPGFYFLSIEKDGAILTKRVIKR